MIGLSGFKGRRLLTAIVLVTFAVAGCAANGGMTDTGKGAVLGGGGGAALGAILDAGNPLAGAIIGAAGGALVGAAVGHYMDNRKQDLEKTLAPEINAGQAQVQILKDNSLLVSMTQQTAFAPQSAVINPGFLPTLQKIASVVSTYGKMSIGVIGHPDRQGTYGERERLADQRAEAVRVQLLGMGVPPVLVTATGNPNSQYMDGRVELILTPIVSG
jgi:outer membrane protein OmpA-like peptidoglycan-associated protein